MVRLERAILSVERCETFSLTSDGDDGGDDDEDERAVNEIAVLCRVDARLGFENGVRFYETRW